MKTQLKFSLYCTVFAAIFFTGVAAQSSSKNSFTLTVDVSAMNPKEGKIFLNYRDNVTGEATRDSAEINTNKILFTGTLEEPVQAMLQFVPKPVPGKPTMITSKNTFMLFLEPAKIKMVVPDSIYKSRVSGAPSHTDYERLMAMKKPYEEKAQELMTQYSGYMRAKDTVNALKAKAERQKVGAEMKEKVYKSFIIENGAKTPVALYALQQYAGFSDLDFVAVEPLFQKIAPQYRELPSGKLMAENLKIAKTTNIGVVAPDFTQNDTLDKPVSLSSFRGKYVLLDFWASWCGPCRAENPNLVKSFHRFKDKGFTVLSVSLDQPGKKHLWLKAIHDDQLTWTHVSDLAFWNNAAAKLYGVKAVPTNILIDPKGIIVAKNLGGEDLNKKLEELLGK